MLSAIITKKCKKMSFFKNLFSINKTSKNEDTKQTEIKEIFTDKYFNERYTEEKLSEKDVLVDGSLRMLKGFFIDNKIEEKIKNPIYHPNNIDQAVSEGMGFYEYCKLFEQDDKQIGLTITIAFSYYLINEFDFKLYKDKTPEFPLRFMTLKYNKDGGIISLYPFEYSLKVLNGEAKYSDLLEKIKNNIQNIPTASEFMENIKNMNKE